MWYTQCALCAWWAWSVVWYGMVWYGTVWYGMVCNGSGDGNGNGSGNGMVCVYADTCLH